ncbi:hypothetical protein NKR23_g6605 [Pleurostoma richardsiae]|uniref:FAD dependent oxidoreductase domain-containing protein n=1 Tax=Pleurostoma richardsiae TaxID=41990 RepID=A0AA38VHS8_9PEZI|nr:hypothetical protein NKR23_g6605 [Pleurostoma richardsiae]
MLIASLADIDDPDFNALYGLAVAEWRELEIQLEEGLPIQWGGVVHWVRPGGAASAFTATYERLRSWGVRTESLAADDVGHLVPAAIPGPVGAGNFLPNHGALDIQKTFDILLRRAKALGVYFKTSFEVTAVRKEASGKVILAAKGDRLLEADKVVISAGAGTSGLAKTIGTHIPVDLVSGTLAYSKPMPLVLHRVLNGPLGSIRQNPDGRVVTGLDYAPGADGKDVSEAYGRVLLKRAAEVVPALSGMELDEMRVGYVPIPEDTRPVVGFCDTDKTIYVAVMMSGITMAALMGRLAATEVLGQPLALLEPYRPDRFSPRAAL